MLERPRDMISDAAYISLLSDKLGVAPTFIACALAKHGRNFKAISQEVMLRFDD